MRATPGRGHNAAMSAIAVRRRFASIAAVGAMLLGVLLPCLSGPASAVGIAGTPIVQRIGPQEYRAAPTLWSLAAAPGKLYVASADGVLIHDGAGWEIVPLPVGLNATLVRRLPDGTVMVGGYDTYGRLEHDPVNGYRYVDLLASSGLPEKSRHLGPVWEIVQTPEGIFIQSMNFLHLLPANGGDVRSWPMGPDMRSLIAFGGDLYARVQGKGIGWMRNGELMLIPGGETFADKPVSSILAWGGSRYVVAASGVWRIDDGGVSQVAAWPKPELPVYVTLPLDGGGFVVGTEDGEVVHVDAGLRVRQFVKLADQAIADLARDPEGVLWAVTETEVLRIGLPSPWSMLGETEGVQGLVNDTAEFDGALWVASTRGLFRLRGDDQGRVRSEREAWVRSGASALFADERALLVGERDGLHEIPAGGGPVRTLHHGTGVALLMPSRADALRVWALADDQLLLLRHGSAGWAVERRWPLDGVAPLEIIETQPGELWLNDERGPPQRWRFDMEAGRVSRDRFGPSQGLPIDGPDRPKLYYVDGALNAWSKGETYRLDADGQRFERIETPAWTRQLQQPGKLSVIETTMGLFAMTPRDLLRRRASSMEWERVQIGGWSSTGFGMPRVSRGGVLRVPVWNGVLQYAPDGPVAPLAPLAVEFDQLLVRGDEGEWQGGQVDRGVMELQSGQAIRMRFALRTLEPGALYRYRLAGVTNEFSDWTDRDLNIRALAPGEYVFEVEAQLPSSRSITPARLRLLVAPRWHEEPLLRVLAGIVFVLLAFWASRTIGRRRVARVEAMNRALEQRIADRTEALERANLRLAEMAVEDPLTGVQNRRALEQALAREWARCAEAGQPLAVLMIDVDHFKRFNDGHGHLEGDRILVEVATLLRSGLQAPLELLARYGGEEFTLLLPGATAEAAVRRAEHLREAVERSRIGLTISVGVAVLVPGPASSPIALLKRADDALYEAKRQGRNRVWHAGA